MLVRPIGWEFESLKYIQGGVTVKVIKHMDGIQSILICFARYIELYLNHIF